MLNVSKCTSRQEHFLYAAWGPVETELVLSTYKTAVGMRKPSIKVGQFRQSAHIFVQRTWIGDVYMYAELCHAQWRIRLKQWSSYVLAYSLLLNNKIAWICSHFIDKFASVFLNLCMLLNLKTGLGGAVTKLFVERSMLSARTWIQVPPMTSGVFLL